MPNNRARSLRRNLTEAETMLWSKLRDRQVEGMKFRRQHTIGQYIADFICLERRLVVEVDGGQHAEAVATDAARTAIIAGHGFRVIRFWNSEVLGNTRGVVDEIADALLERPSASHVSRRRTNTPT
jgi:very-short-patch-repair endonuclease